MTELEEAQHAMVLARQALSLWDMEEFYRVRISCPSHLHTRTREVSNALATLSDALVLLHNDIQEEIKDVSE